MSMPITAVLPPINKDKKYHATNNGVPICCPNRHSHWQTDYHHEITCKLCLKLLGMLPAKNKEDTAKDAPETPKPDSTAPILIAE